MTGYGEAEVGIPQGTLRVSVKTVNHRFFNAHLRYPSGFESQEAIIQKWLKSFFFRGHISLSLSVDRDPSVAAGGLPELDLDRAVRYRGLLETLKSELDLPGQVELSSMVRFGDLFRPPDAKAERLEVEEAALREAVEQAARGALEMREAEGAALEKDMMQRLRSMEDEVALVEDRAPLRLKAEAVRLREAIKELAQQESVDEDRLAREVAYLAERWDINEELVRFRAHLQAFREALAGSDGGPAGKRLGFLVQEMHREANTIGSKANDTEISHASVAIREEIERLREQLENVE
jgi:uncharacterized protein (TIGR00255 family)